MRLSVRLCVVVAAVLDVISAAADHVQPRKLRHNNRRDDESLLLPEERVTRLRHSSDRRGQQRADHQDTFSSHYTQEGLVDTRATFGVNEGLRGSHHSPRERTQTRNLHTVAATRHEPRVLQPVRVDHTGFPIVRDSARNPSPASRNTEDDKFSSHMHQVGRLHNTHDRQRPPYTRESESYQTRISSASRDRLQGLPHQQNAQINNTVSRGYVSMGSTSPVQGRGEEVDSALFATSSRSEERPAHHRHMVPTTRSRHRYPSTVMTRGLPRELDATGGRPNTRHGFSEMSDEVENSMQQRLDHPDQCCGSRVPFDPRTGTPTGPFQRVASAGSIKVVNVPARSNFPPNEVRDLWAAPLDPHTLSLTWTAPGGDLDSGTASDYIIRLSEATHDLQQSQFDAAPEDTLLEASEMLTAAGVYQTAGTRVGVEVPLVRQLQRGRTYYVALKALDNDGYSSGVSNVARFTTSAFSTANTAADIHTRPPILAAEEAPRTPDSRGSSHTNEEAILSERVPGPPPVVLPTSRGSYTPTEQGEENGGGNGEEQGIQSNQPSLILEPSESEGSKNQRKRRKDRKKKNKKSKRKRKGGRKNRRGGRQREGNSDTSVWNSLARDIYAELERWNES